MTFPALAADYRQFLATLDGIAADHTPDAIFRRARRASMIDASRSRAWKARALNLNPDPLENAIALSGMAPVQWEDRWHLAVALPQPNPCGGLLDHVEDVVLIDPRASTAQLLGDRGATHIAPATERERLSVTTDAKAWARSIATERLEWYRLRRDRQRLTQAAPTWTGDIPSALLLAPPAKVRWSDMRAKVIDVPADMQRAVNRAVFAQARLPRIEGRA